MDRHVRPTHGKGENRITVEDWLTALAEESKPDTVPPGWKSVQEAAQAMKCTLKCAEYALDRNVRLGKLQCRKLKARTQNGFRMTKYFGPA